MRTNELDQIRAVGHLDLHSFCHWSCDTSPTRRPFGSDGSRNLSWSANCLTWLSKEDLVTIPALRHPLPAALRSRLCEAHR